MQRSADVMRENDLTAQAAYLESAATILARGSHDVATDEELANLLAVAGRSVRAMQGAAEAMREADESGEKLERAARALAKALHDASQDTVPISVSDVLGTEDA